jgi:type I restriction enzyme S subunit
MAQFETSTINQLTQSDLRSLVVPVPPVSERAAITSFLDAATTEVDAAASTAATEISLLREYRTSLIADVVTGKVDVREASGRLPDKSEEAEALDDTDILAEDDESEVDLGVALDDGAA